VVVKSATASAFFIVTITLTDPSNLKLSSYQVAFNSEKAWRRPLMHWLPTRGVCGVR
jgi:hypothetical protein